MTYNEKKSLYESIMKDIAKTVKYKINEVSAGKLNDDYSIFYNTFMEYANSLVD